MKKITLIYGGTIVNEGKSFKADVLIVGDTIAEILPPGTEPQQAPAERVSAEGCYVIPGVIDTHVHFRQPWQRKPVPADIRHESRAAAAGGVTTFFDMPNTDPPTTTIAALEDKLRIARAESIVNYAFYLGASHDNLDQLISADQTIVPAIKIFMGSSTGGMLVDDGDYLRDIFRATRLPIMAHCEDDTTIRFNTGQARLYGSSRLCKPGDGVSPNIAWPDVRLHPLVRSAEACWKSSSLAVSLAHEYEHRLHIAHISTARELSLPDGGLVTGEVAVGHLLFTDKDYWRYGARIKVNPAIKTAADRDALQSALTNGKLYTIATDHAPHILAQKQGGMEKAVSGMPMIQFSLVAMLRLVDAKVMSIERLVTLMCHNPSNLFCAKGRGYLRKGYYADIAIIRPDSPWKMHKPDIESLCRWSPLLGWTFNWRIERTICNGLTVYADGKVQDVKAGEQVTFRS